MIVPAEIKPLDVIRVRAKDDEDLEDDYYALVVDNFNDVLSVRYYSDTSKIYKGAPLYILEDEEQPIPVESIEEHYINNTSPFIVRGEYYVMEDEIMSDCSNSEIEDLSDNDVEDGEMDDFIVEDDVVDGDVVPPPDSTLIDEQWDKWVPRTSGQSRFKNLVDNLEQKARILADNNQF
jgi:hypothetical protein